jgi:hypothetical protein
MASTIKLIRNLASLAGNAFARLFDDVFGWLWLAALLILVAAFMIWAPIETVGKGGRSFLEIAVAVGGILLISAGAGWAWHKLGEGPRYFAKRIARFLLQLIVPAAIFAAAIWLWSSWNVPDVWNRPLAALTFGDIVQNVFKLGVGFVGAAFITAFFREVWRKS